VLQPLEPLAAQVQRRHLLQRLAIIQP
jgi:hypothetical protein